jgi:hypothetical protein
MAVQLPPPHTCSVYGIAVRTYMHSCTDRTYSCTATYYGRSVGYNDHIHCNSNYLHLNNNALKLHQLFPSSSTTCHHATSPAVEALQAARQGLVEVYNVAVRPTVWAGLPQVGVLSVLCSVYGIAVRTYMYGCTAAPPHLIVIM